MSLSQANDALASVLGVVESGDRAVPSQALEVYRLAREQSATRVQSWEDVKKNRLSQLNQRLRDAGLSPINMTEIEEEVEYLMTR